MSGGIFRLTLICGDARLAQAAIHAGVDRIMVDLERLGKADRQAGRPLFISDYSWEDAAAVRAVLPAGRFFLRLDPWHSGSVAQIERALAVGADGLMLPYFHDADAPLQFAKCVRGRAVVVPLVETLGAVRDLPRLLASDLISEFHVGLNDLALDGGYANLHSLWGHELLDTIADTARAAGKPFGIGGVTDPRLTGLAVDPAYVIAEHPRLGSTGALLGGSFRTLHQSAIDGAAMSATVKAIQRVFEDGLLRRHGEAGRVRTEGAAGTRSGRLAQARITLPAGEDREFKPMLSKA